jgi:hypothetical protein
MRLTSPTDLLSAGELLDRMSILRLKLEKGDKDELDLGIIKRELELLDREWQLLPHYFLEGAELETLRALTSQLSSILKRGWDLENEIREKKRLDNLLSDSSAMKSYIETSIFIHQNNDQRNRTKNQISSIFNSLHKEIKIYG